jgi:hypothetical protein
MPNDLPVYIRVRNLLSSKGIKISHVKEISGVKNLYGKLTGRSKMPADDIGLIAAAIGVGPEEFFKDKQEG